jgi:hypothetical protein
MTMLDSRKRDIDGGAKDRPSSAIAVVALKLKCPIDGVITVGARIIGSDAMRKEAKRCRLLTRR